jgi:beta-lactamase superfamily II metal-dependent hydrolase
MTVLTDAGPPRNIARALDGVMPLGRHYIDLAILTHPQLDHMGGFVDLLDRYTFGAFLWNGREDAAARDTWQLVKDKLRARNIPMIPVRGGDRITLGASVIALLAPDTRGLMSKELNDTGIVELVRTPQFSVLLTADIGADIERELIKRFDVRADV